MTKRLPPRWEIVTLGDLCRTQPGTSEFNKGHYVSEGYPAFSAAGQDGLLPLYQHTGEAVILSSIGAQCGKCFFAEGQWTAIANTQVIWPDLNRLVPRFLFFYLNHFFEWYKAGSAQPFVKLTDSKQKPIPLPPLAVQERIVAILEKADEIRRKRQETLRIADEVLPALFIEMFGDPATNPKGWPVEPLQEFLCSTIERVNPRKVFPDRQFCYVEIGAIEAFQIRHPSHLVGAEAPSRARQLIKAGDVLFSMTRPRLRNIAVVPPHLSGAVCSTGFAVLRPRLSSDTAFLFELVRHQHFTEAMGARAEAKSLYPAVDERQIRAFPVIVPPADLRTRFGAIAVHLHETIQSRQEAQQQTAQPLFGTLLQQAFTGELTAEWEARNADWIAQRQAFYQRLPQLVLLAFLHEKAQHARKASVLITALMKYAFLLQMEGASRRRLYSFVPYHYGPFAQEIYSDLENLQQQGLVTIEEDDEKTRINLTAPDSAEQALQELPDDLRQDVAAIVETYGNLDHEGLLKVVYERYPAYAKKSRRRSTRSE